LILHVLDNSEPLTAADENYLREFSTKKRILVRNKVDLPRRLELPELDVPAVELSCATGAGLEALKEAIKAQVWAGEIKADMLQVMINSRHQDALRRAREATQNTLNAFADGQTLEVAAMELRIATNAIGEVVGKTTTEDLLDSIFSQFCIGK
jgi:tRNA modification GTPase